MLTTKAAEDGAAASGSRLSKVFKGLGATMKAHPILSAAAIITGLTVAIVRAVKAAKEARLEALQKTIDAGTKAVDESKSIRELYAAYKAADEQYKKDGSNKEAYVEATNNLIDALGAEGSAVRDLADDYYDLSDAMDGAINRQLYENIFKIGDAIAAKREELNENFGSGESNYWKDGGRWGNSAIPIIARQWDAVAKEYVGSSEYDALKIVEGAIDDYYSRQEYVGYGNQGAENNYFALRGSAEEIYANAVKARGALLQAVKEGQLTPAELQSLDIYKYVTNAIETLEPNIDELYSLIGSKNADAARYVYDSFVKNREVPKTLDEFKRFRDDYLTQALASGIFEGDEDAVAKSVDTFLSAFSGFENFYGVPRFREEIQSLSKDTIKYLKDGGEATDEMREELQKFLDTNEYSPEEFIELFGKISDSIDESGNVFEQTTAEQIKDLTSLRDELATTSEALEAYKEAMEGGEKGDAAAEMAKVYKSAVESYKSGKVDTNEMRAAADLFFDRGFLAQNNIGLDQVGELLSSGIWSAVFASDDYATNFAAYLQEHATELGDAVRVATDAAGNVRFAYKSVSALAEATNMSEASVVALLDALDTLGVQAMMSDEDIGKLVSELGLIPGQVASSQHEIQGIINTLAEDGLEYWDIVSTLNTLQSAGLINTDGMDDLGTWIADATASLEGMAEKGDNIPITADSSQADGVIDSLEARLNSLTRTRQIRIVAEGPNGEYGPWVSNSGVNPKFLNANASGTSSASGGKTMVNELGPEAVIHNGKANIYNNGRPAVIDLAPGDIVLPADVTKEAFRSGNSKKSIGSAAQGHEQVADITKSRTAWERWLDFLAKLKGTQPSQDIGPGNGGKSGNGGGGSGGGSGGGNGGNNSGDGDIIDWIETAIDRITRKVQSLSKIAESTYKKLSTKLSASKDEIAEITKEIDLQRRAYDRYIEEANSVGLDEELAALVRDGTIDINRYDKDTKKLIDDYRTWYEKALACAEAVDDLHENLASLYEERFSDAQKDFDSQLGVIEHRIAMYEKALDAHESSGYMASAEYYSALSDVQRGNISLLQKELEDLNRYFNEAMDSGEIEEYSDAWYSMKSAIFDVEEAIADANNELIEYANSMRETQWGYFDYARERISKLTEEADFLIDLMSNSDLFGDDGKLNENGIATVGLHAQNFDTYMAQADEYFKEMQRIEEQIANDPYNTTLIQRREELLGLQQDAIQSAEAEKQAVKSLVEEGISKELDALKELIDAYEESLDSAKDLYEYQKKISDKSANIASIQKQLAAYANDSSEENRARVQKLQENLRKAQEDLQETEYDQFIKDQKELLSGLYDEYEEVLNGRLDDIESLFADMIELSNEHAGEISETLQTIASSVGYTMSSGVDRVWADSLYDAVGRYGDNLTAVNSYLDRIEAYVAEMSAANDTSLSGVVKQYASGGLIDYTGIARVDGTPSKPELVLNARDTENFMAFRDVLRDAPYLSALSGKQYGGISSYSSGRVGTTIEEVNVTIPIEHVVDYNDLVSQMQRDQKFEKMLRAMTTDVAVGSSALKKNRFQF